MGRGSSAEALEDQNENPATPRKDLGRPGHSDAHPQAKHSSPVLIFGDAKENRFRQFRVEGKALSVEHLAAHLHKALPQLSPAPARRLKMERLQKAEPAEVTRVLSRLLDVVGRHLGGDRLPEMRPELQWTTTVTSQLERKLRQAKDRDRRKEVAGRTREMRRHLAMIRRARSNRSGPALEAFRQARATLAALAR
jgi:hypothetical protein